MPFSEMQTSGPPAPGQIEVSVFGPNYGECIVVHLGNGNWIVVDSCIHEQIPVALGYFRALGIEPTNSIKAVIATHWHDDHYKGLSQILAAAPNANVWIASALTEQEFFRFVARMGKNKTAVAGNKLGEFTKIIEEITHRHQAGLLSFGFASARSLIFRLSKGDSGHGFPCEVVVLSPSHGDTLDFLNRIAANMPRARQTKRAVPSPSPNEVSMATLVTVGELSILLGADVENSGKPTAGWEAILASHDSQPVGSSASLYKVPHHGSDSAHNPDVWIKMLVANPLAVLTPWRKGFGRLPTRDGANNILELSKESFTTAACN
jgi:metallo-beta-lactamase superfamily protein